MDIPCPSLHHCCPSAAQQTCEKADIQPHRYHPVGIEKEDLYAGTSRPDLVDSTQNRLIPRSARISIGRFGGHQKPSSAEATHRVHAIGLMRTIAATNGLECVKDDIKLRSYTCNILFE